MNNRLILDLDRIPDYSLFRVSVGSNHYLKFSNNSYLLLNECEWFDKSVCSELRLGYSKLKSFLVFDKIDMEKNNGN